MEITVPREPKLDRIEDRIAGRKLIPRECVLNVTSKRIKKLESEMRRLLVRDFVNSSSVLLRLFVEMTINHYCEENPLITVSNSTQLNRKCMEVCRDLERKGAMNREQVKAMESYFDRDGFLKPVTTIINNYVHNKHHIPLVEDVISHWDNLEPLMVACWPIEDSQNGEE